MKVRWPLRVAKVILIAVAAVLLFGLVAMSLWNALIPELFNGPVLSFWQTIGLLVLAHIFFRSGGPWHRDGSWRSRHWKEKFEAKLASLSPEEREAFRAEWHRRCSWTSHDTDDDPPAQKTP